MTKRINHHQRAAELLEGAVAVIEQRGWSKGQLEDENGKVCAIGALNTAATGDAEVNIGTLAYRLALAALAEQAPAPEEPFDYIPPSNWNWVARTEHPIIAWNDGCASDEADIREGFLRAAKDLRNKAVPA